MGAEPTPCPPAAVTSADTVPAVAKLTGMDGPFTRGGTPSTSAAVPVECALAATAFDAPAGRETNPTHVPSEVVVSTDSSRADVSTVKQETSVPAPAVPRSHAPQDDTGDAPDAKDGTKNDTALATQAAGDKKPTPPKWTPREDEQFFGALKLVGPDFEKIAEVLGTKTKSQVKAFHNAEVKKINAVLAPLGVQVDQNDADEIATAMESWHTMKDRLSCVGVANRGTHSKRDTERNKLAWEFKNELDKSVWTEGKKRAKLKALGVFSQGEGPDGLEDGGTNGVIGVVKASPGAVSLLGKNKPPGPRGRPKGSKNGTGTKAGNTGAGSPNRGKLKGMKKSESADGEHAASVKNLKREKTSGKSAKKTHADAESGKARLMLQLFAVDETTKSALQAAGLNPHLELTFRAKKSVPGLMQHLAVKWATATAHLPKNVKEHHPTLQLYPFEAADADSAVGAWNASHDGATATDIFDACGRPAMFRVRYGWVPSTKAALRPHLAPPPPPVHQRSVAPGRDRSRSATPPENVSPRKRVAEEMHVQHNTDPASGSFCHEPLRSGGGFGSIFGGGGSSSLARGGDAASHQFANQFGFGFGFGGGGSIFGADLEFGGPADVQTPPGNRSDLEEQRGVPHRLHGSDQRAGATPVPTAGEFTLSGFADPSEFSNMCREMGLEDPSRQAGRPVSGSKPIKTVVTKQALVSAVPGVVSDVPRRQVLSSYADSGDAANVGVLENEELFSLTRMLGDVPEEKTKPGAGPDSNTAEGGPTSFLGMFSGDLEDAIGARVPSGA